MKLLAFITTFAAFAAISPAQDVKLETLPQKAGYIIGRNIARQLKSQKPAPDLEGLIAGLKSGMAGEKPLISKEDEQKVMSEMQQMAQQAQANAGTENAAKGKAYLEENGKKQGVTTTPSGLQYEVLKEGSGKKPTAEQTVKVHYHGTLIDGTVFDSSVERGMPIEFPLNGVIKGWTEGVQLMAIGSKFKFTIPSELAYGANGPGEIGANSTLIFEVELFEIK
jgi:FKBP-type peptidyl-prolyl cis-trans isomerase FklB